MKSSNTTQTKTTQINYEVENYHTRERKPIIATKLHQKSQVFRCNLKCETIPR